MAAFGKDNKWATTLWLSSVVGWLLAIAVGIGLMIQYGGSAGVARVAPDVWPMDSVVGRATDQSSLLIFLHPRCPCSRATLAELTSLLTHCQHPVRTTLIFIKPADASDDWTNTSLSRDATNFPNATVWIDESGREAQRFGAETSGHTLLYNAKGELLFSGGITQSRGHIGDNLGSRQILALVNKTRRSRAEETPVFGCPLFTPAKCHSGNRACQN